MKKRFGLVAIVIYAVLLLFPGRTLFPQTKEDIALHYRLSLDKRTAPFTTEVLRLTQAAWKDLHGVSFDLEGYRQRIENLAQTLRERLRGIQDPQKTLEIIRQHLFQELGFFGLPEDERNPERSFLNLVLDHKRGNCLGLSLLYLSLGEYLNLPLSGVMVPKHFFIRYQKDDTSYNVETTSQGAILPDTFYHHRFRIPEGNPLYLRTLSQNETLGALYNNLGLAYYATGLFDQAIQAYTEAITRLPHFSEAYSNRALAYATLGTYDQALADANQALALNPLSPHAYLSQSFAAFSQNHYDEAISFANQALALDPQSPEAYFLRGFSYLGKGLPEKALADANQALNLLPHFAEAYFLRGMIHSSQGLHDAAISDYRSALERKPQLAIVHYHLGLAYETKGSLPDAIAAYQTFLQKAPPSLAPYANDARERIKRLQGKLP
ncbi:MAG: tetratricopeptide repeat protein [Candidatus Atribacteria bacterium]|nr:tetratricopeptide repeat protein [Candidatus Atribacteria bacterium]